MRGNARGTIVVVCLLSMAAACRREPSATDAYMAYRKAFDKARSAEDFLTCLSQDLRAKVEATPKDEQAAAFHAFKMLNEYFDVKSVKETSTGNQVAVA